VSHDTALRLLAERRAGVYDALVPLVPGRLGRRRGDVLTSVVDDVDSLAHECGADPEALYRLLRACTVLGVFFESEPRRFALTPVGSCLKSSGPGSLRDFLIAETAPGHWLPWGQLHEAVKAGTSVAGDILGMSVWEYYAKNPEEAHSFARGMGNLSAIVSQDIIRTYDPSGFERIVASSYGTTRLTGPAHE